MNLSTRWQAVAGALAWLGLSVWWANPTGPDSKRAPGADMPSVTDVTTRASTPAAGSGPERVAQQSPQHSAVASRTIDAAVATRHATAASAQPCHTRQDAEGNTEGDCSTPLALNSPFRQP